MTDILMPALSPTMEEGVLAKWNIKAGDSIQAGDVIAEIETDKATMEVEAVDEGVVDVLLVAAGTEGVKVNTPIARLRDADVESVSEPGFPSGSAANGAGAQTPGGEPAPAGPAPPGQDPPSAETAGSAPGTAPGDPADPAAAAEENRLVRSAAASRGDAAEGPPPEPRIAVSPLARRLARALGLPLSTLTGTGPHGRIVKSDVEAAPLQSRTPAGPEPRSRPEAQEPPRDAAPAGPVSRSLEQMGVPAGSYELYPLDGMRKTIARRMTDSFRDIPHFPLTIDLEIDRLLDARTRINAALGPSGVKVSVNDILIKACALALKTVPEANASYTPEGLARHRHADVAVAVAIDGGLITPIVRRAEERALADISAAMKDMAERARTRKLKPEEFQGGTFSLSNLGMMGVKSFASILNEPQGCILSVGTGEKRPVVRGDQLAIATVMTVTLTCDHRVVDGAIGARWLAAFRRYVEDPVVMLA